MDKDIMDVTDLGLEILRSCLLLGIVFYLYRAGKGRFQLAHQGWSAILAGFSLLLLGSVLDITDEFTSLSRFVIIGDTDTQAFLEKFIGFSGGFLFLLIGLIRWIPTVQRLSDETEGRQRMEQALGEEHAQLNTLIESTTDEVFIKDLQGHYILINSAVARAVGKSTQAILGRDNTALYSPDSARMIMAQDGPAGAFKQKPTVPN